MTLEGHNLVQSRSNYPVLDATKDVIERCNQWEHVNSVTRDFILTSLTPELYEKFQNFQYASDM
jgi:hypothetical protein